MAIDTDSSIDTRGVPHTSYYDSTYMADALDLALDIENEGYEEDLYWDALQELIYNNRLRQPQPLSTIALDVGAGSGRVFRKMAAKSAKSGGSLSDVVFIGLDKSPTMLERARRRAAELSSVGTVSWLQGDANDLLGQTSLHDLKHQVGLVLCADGGIGYIEKAADISTFFSHVAQLLVPGSGRVHISLLEIQIAEAYENGACPSVFDDSMSCMDDISKGSDISFKVVLHREYAEDGYHLGQMDTEIIRTDQQGKESLLEICHYNHRFKIWASEALVRVAEEAGLKYIETIKCLHMHHFVFMNPVKPRTSKHD